MSDNGKGAPTPKAPQNQPRTQQIPVVTTTICHRFVWNIDTLEGGGRQLRVILATGEQLCFPFDADTAQQVGHALAAPSVHIPVMQ